MPDLTLPLGETVRQERSRITREMAEKQEAMNQPTNQSACVVEYRPNPRRLIDERIGRLNREVNELHALLRSLPQEMSCEAESALAEIVLRSFHRGY